MGFSQSADRFNALRRQKEDSLLFLYGSWINLKNGRKERAQFYASFPWHAALHQTDRKLYVCGGLTGNQNGPDFFVVDYEFKAVKLEGMARKWSYHALSG